MGGWRVTEGDLEAYGMQIIKRHGISSLEVKVGVHIIPQVTKFKYLGAIVQNNIEIKDINY